jgi:hypothetical protein
VITFIFISIIQALFTVFIQVIHTFLPFVDFVGLASNSGFMFGITFFDRIIGWNFLINSLVSAVLIIAMVKMARFIIGVFSKG